MAEEREAEEKRKEERERQAERKREEKRQQDEIERWVGVGGTLLVISFYSDKH
jgi:hypothetical protein